ncbi:MAG: molybdenum cofactor biosynthesis protein [Proteobacteria bacterium]|nr:molybdenum cofactor biosynthesis protein [Pseudomonadota bacterium]
MSASLTDGHGRTIRYLRLSVTDRCDLRCVYCMTDDTVFLPRHELLSFEELDRLSSAFVARGVDKIRITGGEPLLRKDILNLFRSLSRHVASGALRELTLTTNGSQLARFAPALVASGVRRINVSLDTLDPLRYAALTRHGDLAKTLAGISAAQAAGLKIKLNAVAMRGVTEHEIDDLIAFAHGRGMDLTLIETMPLGHLDVDRADQYLPLDELRRLIAQRWTLVDVDDRTGGPARYVRVGETGGRIGFIMPMSHSFCESCNRIRVSATGQLYTCLGEHGGTDLRQALRSSESDDSLDEAIDRAILRKPRGHDFEIRRHSEPALERPMSVLGG